MALAEEAKRIKAEVDAKQREAPKPENGNTEWTIEFDFDGAETYPTSVAVKCESKVDKSKVLAWKDRDEAAAFARWYGYKNGYRIVSLNELK